MKTSLHIQLSLPRIFTCLALCLIIFSSALSSSVPVRSVSAQADPPTMVKDIDTDVPPSEEPAGSNPYGGVVKGGILYFIAKDTQHGYELWRSDGTADGTWLVKDVNPGSGDGTTRNIFAQINDIIVFRAFDPNHGEELWRTDGTESGTWMLKDINPGTGGSLPGKMFLVRGKLLFGATDIDHGYELWSTDGTSSGTVLVKDPWLGDDDGVLSTAMVVYNDTLIFNVDTPNNWFQLWRSDGTASGTVPFYGPVKRGSSAAYSVRYMTVFNNKVYLDMNVDPGPDQLWSTDGTQAGTKKVGFPNWPGSSIPESLTPSGNTLYFTTYDGENNNRMVIWKLPAGSNTAQMLNIYGSSDAEMYSTWVGNFTDLGNGQMLFFLQLLDPQGGTWQKIDTVTGNITAVCQACNYKSEGYVYKHWYSKVYFAAWGTDSANSHGEELWVTDGTAEGTYEMADLNPGPGSSGPFILKPIGDTMFLNANDGTHGYELWKFSIPLSYNFIPLIKR